MFDKNESQDFENDLDISVAISNYREFDVIYHKVHGLIAPRKGAAKYIGKSPGTLSVWDCTKRNDLKPVKLRNRVYYRISDLDKFQME